MPCAAVAVDSWFLKASTGQKSDKLKSYWSNMVRGHTFKKMKY